MSHLFEPLPLRNLRLSNRIIVSPMCQYSSVDGFANDWHVVHLGSRAVGGAALVFTEASAVTPEGRISPQDLGVYDDGHIAGLARIVRFIHGQKCAAGVQLAHAGRKGSTTPPWRGITKVDPDHGGWQPVGPTSEPFASTYPVPCPLSVSDIQAIVAAFRAAARRALAAGFDVVEIHAAHGYLIHEFLSDIQAIVALAAPRRARAGSRRAVASAIPESGAARDTGTLTREGPVNFFAVALGPHPQRELSFDKLRTSGTRTW